MSFGEDKFKPGDILLMPNDGKHTYISVPQMLQFLTKGDSNLVHPGIIVGNGATLVEFTRKGILASPVDEQHDKWKLYRCKNSELAEFASNIASNLVARFLEKIRETTEDSTIQVGTEITISDKAYKTTSKYAFFAAAKSVFSPRREDLLSDQEKEIEKICKTFEVKDTYYCSEFIIYCYAIAAYLSSIDTKSVMNRDLHYTSPKALDAFLFSSKNWMLIEDAILKKLPSSVTADDDDDETLPLGAAAAAYDNRASRHDEAAEAAYFDDETSPHDEAAAAEYLDDEELSDLDSDDEEISVQQPKLMPIERVKEVALQHWQTGSKLFAKNNRAEARKSFDNAKTMFKKLKNHSNAKPEDRDFANKHLTEFERGRSYSPSKFS